MKAERQAKILDLIVKKEIGTQEELTMELERAGFVATQATVSRDIREMKLTKTVSGMAMAVAAALDHMELPEIVGSIAGDDTIMCAVRSIDDTIVIMSRLRKLVENKNA